MVYRDENIVVAQAEDAFPRSIPDADPEGGSARGSLTIHEIGVTRRILVEVDLTHPRASDLSVTLIAPSGSRALLYAQHPSDDEHHALRWDSETFTRLEALLGQPSAGAWQIIVRDSVPRDLGTLRRSAITLEVISPRRD